MSVRLQFFFRFGQEFFIRQLCIESSSKMISMFSPYDTLRGYTMALSLARIKRNSFCTMVCEFFGQYLQFRGWDLRVFFVKSFWNYENFHPVSEIQSTLRFRIFILYTNTRILSVLFSVKSDIILMICNLFHTNCLSPDAQNIQQ